ncbi:MAG: repressor LexA [Acidobacteria bacterium]|nr:repressor LexA [Acidobacteriota bacterium]
MQPRTKRQKEILEYITGFIETRGFKPSYQQIAKHFNLASKAAVAKHIESLEKQGLITRRRENGSFSLELMPKEAATDLVCEIEWLEMPREFLTLDDYLDETVLVPIFLLGFYKPEKLNVFLVQNDSMLEESIREGDIAVVERRSFARDGDIVVAIIDNERAVLKRIYRRGAIVELRPANKNYESLKLDADQVEVLAVFRGLLRPLA